MTLSYLGYTAPQPNPSASSLRGWMGGSLGLSSRVCLRTVQTTALDEQGTPKRASRGVFGFGPCRVSNPRTLGHGPRKAVYGVTYR